MNKIKEFMSRPYSKGDYYGGIAVVLGIYAILGAAYVITQKCGGRLELKGSIRKKEENTNEDEEA